jgi:hypothetical protein
LEDNPYGRVISCARAEAITLMIFCDAFSVQFPGRFEGRIAKAHAVELLDTEELPMTEHGAITENVSSRGARIIAD